MTEAITGPTTGPKPGFDRRLLPPMLLGSVLNPINSTIVSVALVPIANALGAPVSQTAWLVSALYLATSLGQPVMGRLIDLFGPRRLFLLSTALVGVAGVAGTLAPNLGVLIVARVLLGFGTCAGYPAAMALLRSEAKRTGQDNPGGVLTALAVANQTIAVIGPLLGGLLIAVGGWRATFALNVPLAVVAVVLGLLRLPKTTGTGESSQRGRLVARLDLPGMGLFAAMLTSLLLFLMNPHLRDWYLPAITVAAGAAFAVRELRAATPFIDLRVLGGNTPLLATYGRALVAYVVAYAFLYGFTQWTEEGYGLTPFHAGLVQIPMFLLAIGASIFSGRRQGVRGKLLIGAAGQIVACVLLLTLTGASPLWTLLLVALIFGVPQGLNNLALQNSVYFQADPDRIASSAGLLRTFAYIGSMIASSASAASFGQHADTAGMHRLAWIMLGAGVLYLLLTVFDRTLGRAKHPLSDEKGTTMSRTALLLMDLQVHHLERLTDDYLPRAVHALETARAAGVPVIHVTLRLRAGHADAHPRNKIFGGLPSHLFTADDPGAAIHPDVAPAEGELVVHKNRVSAFAGNNLQQLLAAQDIDHLVLAGIATGGIVLSTALQAADLDYRVTVLSDACADPSETLHDTLITEVLARRGEVATVDEWAGSLTAATTSA